MDIKTIYRVAATAVACVIGAGFISGQEVWEFFGEYGWFGILPIILAATLFGLAAAVVLWFAHETDAHDMEQLVSPTGNPIVKWGVAGFEFVLHYAFYILMAAATGALGASYGLPNWVGVLFFCVICTVMSMLGIKGLGKVFGWMVPIRAVAVIGVALYSFTLDADAAVLCIMLYYSLWLTCLLLLGVVAMFLVSKKIGGGSAKFFMKLQKSVGRQEGFVQEMMNGQKVIKVFCHEEACKSDFDAINQALYDDAYHANAFANSLGPIIMNIGNVLYAVVALVGGLFLVTGFHNVSISGLAFSISIVIPFLNMTKQFTGNINQVSQQINSIAMAMAGAERVFGLMDEIAEADEGYVTLVNAEIAEDGSITETEAHTGHWAWKHPHGDGSVTYTLLEGDVRMTDVDFSYEEGKPVLRDVSVYAEPGQKVAFVGATGAGKTTITNLINRFYDIEDGKIRYDGININKIKKSDLRRSLGIVLQETNLFTGTVMDNIRYGKLDATDEECINAAKLAGADDFITRMPEGYDTMLTNNGANLSQGQRQLISIARAAVADPPVMILDEATSSIDTRTEAIVQKGMDALMKGRTVFVIAHRLSTVRNADVIMVLDHGRIIERGNHEKLIAEKGQYYQLYTGAFELE